MIKLNLSNVIKCKSVMFSPN